MSALHDAVRINDVHAVRALLTAGTEGDVDVNVRDYQDRGNAPLHVAARHGYVSIIELFVAQKKTLVDLRNKDGRTPLFLAVSNSHMESAKLLLSTDGVKVDQHDKDEAAPLHNASSMGDIGLMKLLIDSGADVNRADYDGRSPLHYAVQFHKVEAVKVLVATENVSLNSKDRGNPRRDAQPWTPLHHAAARNYGDVVLVLACAEGVDVSAMDGHGNTPLHVAAGNGFVGVVRILLTNGADVESTNIADLTPIDVAQDRKFTLVVELLTSRFSPASRNLMHVLEGAAAAAAGVTNRDDCEDGARSSGDSPNRREKTALSRLALSEDVLWLCDVWHQRAKYVWPSPKVVSA